MNFKKSLYINAISRRTVAHSKIIETLLSLKNELEIKNERGSNIQ